MDLRSDHVGRPGRVVAPLSDAEGGPPPKRLEPALVVDGRRVVPRTGALLAVPAPLGAGRSAADLTGEREAIRRALDIPFVGL